MGLLSIAGDLLGGFLGNEAAEDRQNDAQDFSAQQFATRYQTQVADMKAAGLNPMLSYMTGATGQPSGAVTSAVSYGNLGTNSYRADLDAASAGQVEANTGQIFETTKKIIQEVSNLQTAQEQAQAVTKNLGQQYQNLVKEGYNLTEVGNQIRATVDNLNKQNLNLGSVYRLMEEQIKSEAGRASLLGLDVSAANDLNNMGRAVGQFEGLFRILQMVLHSR